MLKTLMLIVIVFSLNIKVHAEPIVNINTEYYSITGDTAANLRKDMNANRSGDYDAHTHWYIKWNFHVNEQPTARCAITDVTTQVDIKFILPEWADSDDADETLKARWNVYYTALIAHENGHKDLAIKATAEIEHTLLSMNSHSSCNIFKKEANALGYGILDKYKALQKQYDADTNHGMKYGAVFP